MANMARDLMKEQYQYAYDKDREQITYQPYRTTPLITPGAKVKRDTPIVASYLNMHPDPQVRGAAPHVSQVSSGLNSMLGSANEQLARKIIHHQFNTPANLYSQDNMASSIQQQTGIAPQVSGAPRKEFSIQNSETLKMILEEDQQKPATQHKPKSHVVYDVHEAKAVNQPPSMFTNSDKIAQSYSFNKLMWSVGTAE
ncbi:hypothetical protein FJT64_013951 [Amphibalanus amphitrite]|uniref:Zasp-like motif domain-containing protein n=1 Tax=Amphibalanus amphitrite TaxID=1232801 RepID=A0A6A4V126_AMPAM|nr:hypothetical protein FJT64_013951 [Amphibalanus amphitrite]